MATLIMGDTRNKNGKTPDTRSMLMPGLLIIVLSAGGYCALKWQQNSAESARLRRELRATNLELEDSRFQNQAKDMIIRRQLEMIRSIEAREEAKASSNP